MSDRKGYVDPAYLEQVAQFVAHIKRHSYQALRLSLGQTVMDVGCGPASDTLALAKEVGEEGRVIGVDVDPTMIEAAQAKTTALGLDRCVSHVLAPSTQLPQPDNSVDACRSERLFQHLPGIDPQRTMSEMWRVTKPGGRVAVLDTDWGSLSIAYPQPSIERRLANMFAADMAHNGYAGRQLRGLMTQQGCEDLSITLFPVLITNLSVAREGVLFDRMEALALQQHLITPHQLQTWRTTLEHMDRNQSFCCSFNQVLVAATKPHGG